jgi:hypothetical protein
LRLPSAPTWRPLSGAATRAPWRDRGAQRARDPAIFDAALRAASSLPGCRLRWYAPWEACDVIERAGNLIMVGDSLTRGHHQLALHQIMSEQLSASAAVRNPEGNGAVWAACG